jgi:phospholipid/cholesterol/gamma-HCH transport system substrate-binding protein
LIGLLAIVLAGGAVALTGMVLTGAIHARYVTAYAEFTVCGQGLHPDGDVKERGVLVGSIGNIELVDTGQGNVCRIALNLQPDAISEIPENVGAQIRAKTLFGEKWVELLYPEDPSDARIKVGQTIGLEETIDPLEVETILNTGLPILDAIDPEKLAGALNALAEGFAGHENNVIAGIVNGNRALDPLNRNSALMKEGIHQLAESGAILKKVSPDLLAAMGNLSRLNSFTVSNRALIAEALQKNPELLRQVSDLFVAQFGNLTRIVDRGATVIGLIASRTDDLDKLLKALPVFNSKWIRNLNATCRFRQPTTEPGKSQGDVVPGRCWRVHNLISDTQGPYPPGKQPKPHQVDSQDYESIGITTPTAIDRLLFAPQLESTVQLPKFGAGT